MTNPVLASLPPSAVASGPAASKPKASAPTSDFDTFLKMLTAQARNQDPLEPIDSTEYAAQLAQFSMVEQQVQTNDTLTALVERMSATSMASLAGWVGMEARAATPVAFDGAPITVSPDPAPLADRAVLVVRDAAGREVQRADIPTVAGPIQWAGVGDDGNPVANGVYNFAVESYRDGQLVLTEPAEVYGRIVEAQMQDGETVLILQGGLAILSASVTALRGAGDHASVV